MNRVNWDGFGPANQGKAGEKLQQRKQERPNRVDMRDWIQGHPAQVACGIVPAAIGHPGMRSLMDAQREKQDGELNENAANINALKQIQVYGSRLSECRKPLLYHKARRVQERLDE